MIYKVTIRRTEIKDVSVSVEASNMREAGRLARIDVDAVPDERWSHPSTHDSVIAVSATGECSECNGRRWFRGMEGEDVPCPRCNT